MNTKIKCLIIDDELPGLTYIKLLCEQLPELEVVKVFNHPRQLLQELPDLDFDLCISDINMPELSGLQLAKLLNNKLVIFTTAYKEFAASAFDLNAVDYLLKPVKRERLQQAIHKAQDRLLLAATQENTTSLQLNTDQGKTLINISQLAYIKTADVDSRDKLAVMMNGDSITLKNISFEKLQQLLPSNEFTRVNKKELIALKIVQSYSASEITTGIASETSAVMIFSLSDTYKNEFAEKILNR
ncbi:LytR/AlgR family response regulator transcription factor [Polluticaenibacter yanchengensis]|uniref:Response regulator n=1 Tax=Polluticaenibacter yanchengensis TaxID=3014562 RepID=A0ABT4UNH2_9BACT|nr:response regulator [Chitinophagaceae bacterium LY-5]